ncbi:hypothetical protein V7S43_016473 [Phytophthora oleae]|uniref:Uncharacterized protein n=1 Tax=Phytophthora oleae TaxID=2107226 RepID=A0ABD3EWR5_9STRA
MGKSRLSADKEELLKQLVTRYAEEGQEGDDLISTNAQIAFWSDMREVLSVNKSSTGFDILDDIAEAVIDQTGYASDALGGPIHILLRPTRQRASKRAELHPRFEAPSPKNAPSSSKPSSAKKRKERSPRESSPSSSPERKKPFFTVELADKAPHVIREDLEKLYRRASATNKAPFQLAYTWEGSQLGTTRKRSHTPTWRVGVGGTMIVTASGTGSFMRLSSRLRLKLVVVSR